MDPPQHTRYRRALGRYFTIRSCEQMRPWLEDVVDSHLDALESATPPVDLVSAFAAPVASLAICELLGVPHDQRDRFQRDSTTLFSLTATVDEGTAAMCALTDRLRDLVRRCRAQPGQDLLSRLVTTTDLNDDELAGTGVLLLSAGLDSVVNMLALGALAMLCHPDQMDPLRTGSATIDNAVEELLRYLTVFQFGVPRTALEDVDLDLDGHLIRAGECVTLSLSAANRDPRQFDHADELDVRRATTGHVAFGYGIHQCLGQNLARLELQVGLRALFRRFPTLRTAVPMEEIPLAADNGRYGVRRLPVTW
jgi:cytochrome P450